MCRMSVHGLVRCSFFFNDTATTEIYTLSLHDALPIFLFICSSSLEAHAQAQSQYDKGTPPQLRAGVSSMGSYLSTDLGTVNLSNGSLNFNIRSEEHTSELQSQSNLVCRLLLEKKNKK